MAESTLSITHAEISREVGHFLGWDRDSSNWSADQTTDFGDILKRGLRRFYYPPPLQPGEPRHEWSFLRPSASLSLTSSDFDYDLPDDFSGVIIEDSLTMGVAAANRRLTKIDAAELRALQSLDDQSGEPVYYAVRVKAHAPTTGMRYEALFYPTPNAAFTVLYNYVIAPDVITSVNIYPLGGAAYSECILQSILAAAEEKMDDDPQGVHQTRYIDQLAACIRLDNENKKKGVTL